MDDVIGLLKTIIPHGARVLGIGSADYGRLFAPLHARSVSALHQFPAAGNRYPIAEQTDVVVWVGANPASVAPDLIAVSQSLGAPLVVIGDSTEAPSIDKLTIGAGTHIACRVTSGEHVGVRIEPTPQGCCRNARVLVVSCAGWQNFGDRLGYHLLGRVLPASACVRHVYFPSLPASATDCDLLVLCLGTSIFHRLINKQLLELVESAPVTIGIFGTQYRRQIDRGLMSDLISRLNRWYARSEEDLYIYGHSSNSVHLGDWLIDCFHLSRWTKDETLTVGSEIMLEEVRLDRMIQRIQTYRSVVSARLHPFLCALTSADEVSYREQREFGDGETSGKFRSLLLDIFRREYGERERILVDREAVVRYKEKVGRGIVGVQQFIDAALAGS